jgi:hypothetical protein
MDSAFYQWLVEAEDFLLRMIRGVFRFITEGLWKWIYHFVVDTLGPVAIRSCRVLGLACLWLMIVFSPLALGCVCTLPGWWRFGSVAWVVMAILGSMWGLNRAIQKRKAELL